MGKRTRRDQGWRSYNLRLSPDLAEALDRHVDKRKAEEPDQIVTRLNVIREVLRKGLEASR